jgi:hypothetical protein
MHIMKFLALSFAYLTALFAAQAVVVIPDPVYRFEGEGSIQSLGPFSFEIDFALPLVPARGPATPVTANSTSLLGGNLFIAGDIVPLNPAMGAVSATQPPSQALRSRTP